MAQRLLALALGAYAFIAPAAALAKDPPAPTASAGPPRLIVAVSIDQFSADLFAQYRQRFTGGLARLTQGAVFPSAYQGHAATETCPGHSTLLTGVRPGRNGIVANTWYDPSLARADKRIYCVEDETNPASTSSNPVVSANHLKVPALGEWMKRQWPASRTVAVSGKDRAAIMMGGHQIDEVYWFKGGQFATLNGKTLSPAAQAASAAMAGTIAKGAPAMVPPAFCAPRDYPVAMGKAGSPGAGRFALEKGSADQFRVSPRMDAATLDLAARLVDQDKLGRGAAPDLLAVSLSATDYVGHALGNEGLEMCIQLAELDKGLGAFFARLDKAGIDYAVVLSADHGVFDAVERLDQQGFPAAVRVDPALSPAALGKAVASELGLTLSGPLLYGDGPFGDFYFNRGLTAQQLARAMGAVTARLKAHPQVAAVYSAGEIGATPVPTGSPQDWTLLQRARASFDPARSGDLLVLLKRGVVPIAEPAPGYVATHGSVWDYDRRVPLMFWRKGMVGFEQPAPVETVDIAPTLAAWLGLAVPAGSFDGRCLDLDGGAGDSCAGR